MAENEKMEQTTQAAATKTDKAQKAQKDKKVEKKSKPSIFAKISRWLRELKSELKKVQWPTTKQTANNTVIVMACVAVVGAFIWVFDFAAGGLVKVLITLAG